jgi:hypothetical protein
MEAFNARVRAFHELEDIFADIFAGAVDRERCHVVDAITPKKEPNDDVVIELPTGQKLLFEEAPDEFTI